ncbi:hypothetical protein Tco_0167545 [Tanacetum coccineum]
MFGYEVTSHVQNSRLMDEFDKFAAKEGESLESMYEMLTTLVNIMDRNNVPPISVSINTKFLNCLQPEWRKYVTIIRHNQNKDNGENIMKSIKEGPFHMGTVSDVITGGTEGVVQQRSPGIPKDIYSLINHYTDAKDIWENVKMILEGSELTKDDRESQLYDEFEHFRQIKGETIQGYYEVHQQKTLFESLCHTLALFLPHSIVQITSPQTNNQLRASSNARNKAMVQDGKVVVQDVRGRYNANIIKKTISENNARGKARECPRPKRLQDSDYFKDKMLLMQAQENGAVLDEEQSLFLAGE